jgi:hypothetical protein
MVMRDRQVLDARAPASEGGRRNTNDLERTPTMDPAALGTLRIGLDAIEAEARYDRAGRPTARGRATRPVRVTLAAALRRIAVVLDRPATGEAAP